MMKGAAVGVRIEGVSILASVVLVMGWSAVTGAIGHVGEEGRKYDGWNPTALPHALEPFPMEAVALTEGSEWRYAEIRNREVLLSLNMSQWACHFTTTANLTACAPLDGRWITLIKESNGTFTKKLGFLPAGNDIIPHAQVSISQCQSICLSKPKCLAVTFQESTNADNKTNVKCYWKGSVAGFSPTARSNCVANGNQSKPSCTPLPGEMGIGGYYGHYQGHWMSATAFLYNATRNETVRAAAAANIDVLANVMAAWKAKYGVDGYLFPYDPLVWDKLLAGNGAGPYYSVPFYTLHKLMAGLLDQHVYAGNGQAFEMVQKMGLWVHYRVQNVINGPGGMDLWQKVLLTEWGGMNDVLYNLYQHTGNELYLQTGRLFNGYVFTARLAAGEDDLAELPFPHANFHLPEIIGNARAYQLTGNITDRAIVNTFFQVLTTNHSYATGGSNSGECWQNPRDLGNFLTDQTEESCTQYNVLKVARRSFLTSGSAELADFYERAIFNGIIGNQNRADPNGVTSYIYMQPLGGANFKPWGKSDFGFPCCWGTLSESFAKLRDSVFFWDSSNSPTIYVNLFVSASVHLAKLGNVVLEQTAHFPTDPTKTSTIKVLGTARFSIKLRVPNWSNSKFNRVLINGKAVSGVESGQYVTLERSWMNGDTVEVIYPMSLWTKPLNDYHPWHNATLAFMYGPLVLAGVHLKSDIWVPKGGTKNAILNPGGFITRNSSTKLDFEATAHDGSKIQMIPLKDVVDEQYVTYFMTAGTKPPQPPIQYCPHSAVEHNHVSGIPHEPSFQVVGVSGRGVQWSIKRGKIVPAKRAP